MSSVSLSGAGFCRIRNFSAACASGESRNVLRAPPALTSAAVEAATRSDAVAPSGWTLGRTMERQRSRTRKQQQALTLATRYAGESRKSQDWLAIYFVCDYVWRTILLQGGVTMRRAALLLVLCTACGLEEAGRPVPDEATLCRIMIGKTTPDEAREVLGPESMSTGAASQQRLIFRYGPETEATFVILGFGADDKLADAITMGVNYPRCWRS
jgi:hypothetical protein